MVIGLTGGSGSGKSVLCGVARDMGFCVIDADKVGHEIIKKGNSAYDEIIESFGEDILLPSGEIDRKALGGIVFADREKLALLNEITHKRISERIERIISENGGKIIVIEAALLFESGMDGICDFVIAVVSPVDERIKRICERDGIKPDKALLRLRSQQSDEFYTSKADKTIYNDGDISKLKSAGEAVFKEAANGKII